MRHAPDGHIEAEDGETAHGERDQAACGSGAQTTRTRRLQLAGGQMADGRQRPCAGIVQLRHDRTLHCCPTRFRDAWLVMCGIDHVCTRQKAKEVRVRRTGMGEWFVVSRQTACSATGTRSTNSRRSPPSGTFCLWVCTPKHHDDPHPRQPAAAHPNTRSPATSFNCYRQLDPPLSPPGIDRQWLQQRRGWWGPAGRQHASTSNHTPGNRHPSKP